jgi:hypothetical protein
MTTGVADKENPQGAPRRGMNATPPLWAGSAISTSMVGSSMLLVSWGIGSIVRGLAAVQCGGSAVQCGRAAAAAAVVAWRVSRT